MAQRVVQGLELVQIDKQQRPTPPRALAQRHGLLHSVEQQAPVGQVGERIVEGQMSDLFLGFLALADVRERGHIVRDLSIVTAHGRNALQQRIHLAVLAPVPDFTQTRHPGRPEISTSGRKTQRRGART